MKQLKRIFTNVDIAVDQRVRPMGRIIRRVFPVLTIFFLLFISLFSLYKVLYDMPLQEAKIVAEDVRRIASVLHDIDKRCNILSIKPNHDAIDFLTVGKSFAGSEVGSLNLAYPQHWQGPYLKSNPTFKGTHYDLVRAKDGFYVVPGRGMKLPNGLIMGRDVIIDGGVVAADLIKPNGPLHYQGLDLAQRLGFTIGDWDAPAQKKREVEETNKALREFSRALPYTCRDADEQIVLC